MSKSNEGLTKRAYDIIKNRLIDCTYKPDSMLNEAQISEEIGSSRTPIREAIIQLEKEGFLRVLPKKGIYVSPITANEIMQIFQARKEIEPTCLLSGRANIDMAVIKNFKERFSAFEKEVIPSYKLDTAMHLYIVESCRNEFIINMMHAVFDKNTRIIIASKENQLHVQESKKEHIEILDALLEEDFYRAQKALSNHIDHCRIAAMDSFYSNNSMKFESYKDYLN
ncbi:MAG: GntR family transcriptional regulator [Sphaerochaetaceae bacterium]|nr:GntR family transcriptional regulator [Sphaerochaetaceae bacterium]